MKQEILQNTVAKERQARGQTQEELAQKVGVTRQTIIALEKGNYAPSVVLALRIAQHFHLSVESLFSYE
jgi:putative transcriptional regulator